MAVPPRGFPGRDSGGRASSAACPSSGLGGSGAARLSPGQGRGLIWAACGKNLDFALRSPGAWPIFLFAAQGGPEAALTDTIPMEQPIQEAGSPGPGKGPLPATLVDPHPRRLDGGHPYRGAIIDAHRAAIASGEALYLDPESGLWVMTAATLWERACCSNGCRHCPHLER